jgi:hypothetical protein
MRRRCKEDHDGGSDCAGRGRGFHDRPRATTEHGADDAGTLCRNPLAREVGDDRVKLAVGAGVERLPQAIVELVGKQPALVGGASQLLGDVRSIGVRCTHVPVLCHRLAPSRIASWLWHEGSAHTGASPRAGRCRPIGYRTRGLELNARLSRRAYPQT